MLRVPFLFLISNYCILHLLAVHLIIYIESLNLNVISFNKRSASVCALNIFAFCNNNSGIGNLKIHELKFSLNRWSEVQS